MTKIFQLDRRAIEWRHVEGEVVALDLKDQMYLGINPSGAVLWSRLEQGATRDDLIATLVAEFEIDEATAATDVDAFVAGLEERGVLKAATPGPAEA